MDSLTENIRKEAPWQMMFADDVVLGAREKNVLELELEQWREALEKRGMKVSRAKTEYMCLNGTSLGSVKMQSAQLPQVTEFKYLGSTLQSDGDMTTEINKRNRCGWNNWRKMSGVICDKRLPPHVKGKIHKTIVQPAMLYGMETVPPHVKGKIHKTIVQPAMLYGMETVPPHVKGKIHKTIVQPAMLYGTEPVPVTSSHVKKLEMTEMKMGMWPHTKRPCKKR